MPQLQGKLAAGLLSAMVQHANFERRQGQLAAAKAVFEGVIEAEAGKAEAASHVFAVIQYAAFLQQAVGDSSAARLIYEAALAKRTSAKSLWEVCCSTSTCQASPEDAALPSLCSAALLCAKSASVHGCLASCRATSLPSCGSRSLDNSSAAH